eukprot:TRINITY_DN18458_c0_g1_i3.p1 TRINITY_DN18458_c0_g1~~TRINITY_DN18458_c0_g1_i3.p1  ORF type:complete len:423 (+),score=122.30 TRINITY_DN18458_c0_g1_i3:43-1269(+)
MRLQIVSSGCANDIPRLLHPTGLEVDGSEALGAVVANLSITLLCGLLSYIVFHGVRLGAPRLFAKLEDFHGFVEQPAVPLFLFLFFYQGLTLAGMTLVMYSDTAPHLLAGVAVLCICAAVPLVLFHIVGQNVPTKAVYAIAATRNYAYMRWIVGPGEWVNLRPYCHWVQRYSSVIRTFKQGHAWYFFIDMAASFAISALHSTIAETAMGCGHKKMACAVIFLTLFVLEGALWPHARPRDSACDILTHSFQGIAMVLIASGFYHNDAGMWAFTSGVHLLRATEVLLLMRVALDVCTEAYIALKGRRANLQEDMLRAKAMPQVDADILEVVSSEGHPEPDFTPLLAGSTVQPNLMSPRDRKFSCASTPSSTGARGRTYSHMPAGRGRSGLWSPITPSASTMISPVSNSED